MTCPSADRWNLLSLELLAPEERDELQSHARSCPACQLRYTAARQDHALLLRSYEALDRDHEQQRDLLLAALPDGLSPASAASPGGLRMTITALRRRPAAWLVLPAACLLVALLLFYAPRSNVAWADVVQALRQVRNMICHVTNTFTAPDGTVRTSGGTVTMAADGPHAGVLYSESGDVQLYSRTTPDGQVRTISEGTWAMKLPDDAGPELFPPSPEAWIAQLLRGVDAADRQLGATVIDGRKSIGFELAAWKVGLGFRPTEGTPADARRAVVRLWVDVETHLPVRMELEMPGPLDTSLVQVHEQFRWNVPESEFPQPPPETAPALETAVEVPPVTEETLLVALREYAEQSASIQGVLDEIVERHGAEVLADPEFIRMRERVTGTPGYPAQLDHQWIAFDFGVRYAFLRVRARLMGGEAPAQPSMAPLSCALFYKRLLLEQREPEYFGAQVAPGATDAVLLRWRLDDGRHRVVYGDLRTETVP